MRKMSVLAGVLVMVGATGTALAADAFWNGGAGGNWAVPGNWINDGGLPLGRVPAAASSDWVTLDTTAGPHISSDVGTIRGLTVGHNWNGGGAGALSMGIGSLTINETSAIGDNQPGTLDMASGTMTFLKDLEMNNGGHVQLDGGLLWCDWLQLNTGSSVDVAGGTLQINWDVRNDIPGWVSTGKMTGNGLADLNELIITYDANVGKGTTTIDAVPEPAALALLALGGFGFLRRRRA